MAQGEIKWSSAGKSAPEKFVRTPLPNGEYDLKFNAADIEQAKGEQPGKVPYVKVPFEVLGTASGDNGKNRKLFHNIFLHMEASPKDGLCMLERAGGVLDLAKALGEECSFSGIQVPYQKYVGDDRQGEMRRIPIANPAEVLKWLKAHDGAVVRAQVKIERSKGYDPKNVVDYFVPSADEATEEEYEMEETEAPGALVEETEEEEAPAELEEEAPAEEEEEDLTATFNKKVAAKTKAPPSKVKQGPAGKSKK